MRQGSPGVQPRRWLALAIACLLYAVAPAQAAVVGSSEAYLRWQFAPRINGDLNNDGSVDAADNTLISRFRGAAVLNPGDRRDLNRDGVIDLRDARELQRLACTAPNGSVVQ